MRSGLPSRVPLPEDVRDRALDAVLAGLDEPAPRRFRSEPAVVAVVIVLVVGLTVLLSGRAAPNWVSVASAPIAPAPEVDIRSAEGMVARCAAAVAGQSEYPPASEWEYVGTPVGSDLSAIVVDDSFACRLTPDTVYVSGTRATPAMGDVGVVGLGPGVVALLNPRQHAITPDVAEVGGPDAAVQILRTSGLVTAAGATFDVASTRFTVPGRYTGPLPEPQQAEVIVQDRHPPVRALGDTDDAYDEDRIADDNDLNLCLASLTEPADPSWTAVRRLDGGPVPVLLARLGDQQVGLCRLAPTGPVMNTLPMPSVRGSTPEPTTPETDLEMGFLPNGAPYVAQGADDVPTSPCSVADGIEVCGDPADGRFGISLLTSSEDLMIPLAPGR